MTTPPEMTGVWDWSPAGYPAGAVMFRGDVLFPAGIEPGTTNTAVCVFGPGGAVVNMPALAQGEPGPSPIFRKLDVIPIPYGQEPPSPQGQFILVSPGGPGIAAVYDVVIYLNQGAPGNPGTNATIVGAGDVQDGTPPDGGTLIWNSVTNTWDYIEQLITGVITGNPDGTAAATTTSRVLDQVAYGPYKYASYPQPLGQCVVSGTQNTVVTLSANIGSPTGPQVGVGYGVGGAGAVQIGMFPWMPHPEDCKIAANDTAEIYYSATQTTSTLDPWSTVKSTTTITVNAVPAL